MENKKEKSTSKNCYWCGISLTDATNKKEHVPPRCFFPQGYKKQLITVPSCEEHNNMFSELDYKFLVLINAIGANQVSIDHNRDKIIRGLNRAERKKFVQNLVNKSSYVEIDGTQRHIIESDVESVNKFIEKVTRGLYFYHYQKPAKGTILNFSFQFYNPDLNYEDLIDFYQQLSDCSFKEGCNNNPAVFSYKYVYLPECNNICVLILTFYERVEFVSWILPENN